jgi:uncharacterized protein YnzC (UPF0291/DUF896 family)
VNIDMKKPLICTLLLLLTSCSLFEGTPKRVVEGQRAAYQGVLLAEENDKQIIKRYVEDVKATVTYHVNFTFEPKIDAIRINPDLSREEKSEQIAEMERKRQAQLDEAFSNIDKNAADMLKQTLANHRATKRLIESIYNYLSTSPIEVDIIPFLIEKFNETRHLQN